MLTSTFVKHDQHTLMAAVPDTPYRTTIYHIQAARKVQLHVAFLRLKLSKPEAKGVNPKPYLLVTRRQQRQVSLA
jgi:hypothetical protein